jgi:N,N'-diacetylchitobiose transport system substrate-binding protein
MKRRYVAVAGLAAALAVTATVAATVASKAQGRPSAGKITVWLMDDAQKGWPDVVAAANRQFEAQHPGVQVDVQYQQWTQHLTKLDAALAGGNAPDVVEFGNTETFKYMGAKALTPLNKKAYANSSTWVKGLEQSCHFNGKLYCVPYYAGSRAVIYRKDYYRKAGIKSTPKSLNAFVADGRKLMKKFGKNPAFSAYYHPGKNWYVAMGYVYDYGGRIATYKGGKWHGALNSPRAIRGLTVLKSVVHALSRASKTTDEAHPYPSIVMAKGNVASFIGSSWEWPYTLDPKVGNPKLDPVMGAYPMPSHHPGKMMPTLLGGSDLGIPVTSQNKGLARDWINAFTSTKNQRTLIKETGWVPNTTKLIPVLKANPKAAPFARAAAASFSVPPAANWANVESGNVLQNMLASIMTGQSSIKSATNRASAQITSILNAKS